VIRFRYKKAKSNLGDIIRPVAEIDSGSDMGMLKKKPAIGELSGRITLSG